MCRGGTAFGLYRTSPAPRTPGSLYTDRAVWGGCICDRRELTHTPDTHADTRGCCLFAVLGCIDCFGIGSLFREMNHSTLRCGYAPHMFLSRLRNKAVRYRYHARSTTLSRLSSPRRVGVLPALEQQDHLPVARGAALLGVRGERRHQLLEGQLGIHRKELLLHLRRAHAAEHELPC